MRQKRELSRGWKIVRNLTAALLLAALALRLWGWPAWMGYWAFRHLEAQYLLTPSQVILTNQSRDRQYTSYLTEGENWITVGRSSLVRYGGLPFSKAVPWINHLLLKEGIVVTALTAPNRDGGMTVAVWGAPSEAVSGTMEVDLAEVDGGVWDCPEKETFSARDPWRKDGWLFFELTCSSDHGEQEACAMDCLWNWDTAIQHFVGEHPYRMTLTDAQGAELVFQTGTLPPRQLLSGL